MVERGGYGDTSTMTHSGAITAQEMSRRAHLEMGNALSARAHGVNRRSPLDALPDDQVASLAAQLSGASGTIGHPPRVLNQLYERLLSVREGLEVAAGRFSHAADSILGPDGETSAGDNARTRDVCITDMLMSVAAELQAQTDRLHHLAGRVERIG